MKKIIFIILVTVLFIPVLQNNFSFFKFKKLNGATIESQNPKLSFSNWFEGKFQQDYENFHSSNYGCRNLLIRLFNSMDFALYNLPHSYVTVGKEGYLFEEGYLDEITGASFIGADSINRFMNELSFVQSKLSENNIFLATILAPGKPYYYHEYLLKSFL